MKQYYPSKGWILILAVLAMSVRGYASTDTIAPEIVTPAMDLDVECGNGVLDSLSIWFDRFGGLTARDTMSPVELRSLITASEANDRLDIDIARQCGGTGSVEVGFYAVDTCGNFSDTSFATFSVVDTRGPEFLIGASDLTVSCSAAAEDSLQTWIDMMANAVVDDQCSATQRFVSFSWTDNEGNAGAGTYPGSTAITLMQTGCDYRMTVAFVAEDECGNTSSSTASFALVDMSRPVFENTLEDTVIVTCDNVPSARSVNVNDNCDGTLLPVISDQSSQNPDENTCGHYNYQIDRIYTATDACGNTATMTQVIFVADTLEPRFLAPNDTTIRDVAMPTPDVSGAPVDVVDNCSSQILQGYTDDMIANGCTLTINRRWNIQDQCGSSLVLTQTITVIDEALPIVVTPPSDRTISCGSNEDIDQAFAEWVSNSAGAVVVDENSVRAPFAAVPGSYDRDDESTWPGTPPGALDEIACPSDRAGLARYEDVDFVYVDGCGNVLVLTSTFGVGDTEPPVIVQSPDDVTLDITDATTCEAPFEIKPIQVADNCAGGEGQVLSTGTVFMTAANENVPVDPVTLTFGPLTSTQFGTDPIDILITISSVDANTPTEFFFIVSETGETLGRTRIASAQCGSSDTRIQVTPDDLRRWSDDGQIDIILQPNVIADGPTLSVNLICNNSNASGRMVIAASSDFDVTQSVIVDGAAPIALPEDGTSVMLDAGRHEIVYQAMDCAQNVQEVTQIVTVTGGDDMLVSCPRDTVVALDTAMCTTTITLSTDIGAESACGESKTLQSVEVSGATEIASVDISGSTFSIEFNPGDNRVTYTFSDDSQCQSEITVVDDESPQLVCNDNVFGRLHPSGLLPLVIDTATVIQEVSDNCGDVRIDFEGIDVSCDQLNEEIRMVVRVTDGQGNVTQCNSIVRVVPLPLEPSVEPILCFGDSIRLIANAPEAPQPDVYSYSWTGPDGFSSSEANPVIADATLSKSGEYVLTLTGANGCVSTGRVEVVVRDFTSPDIMTDSEGYCTGDSAVLSTQILGDNIVYEWYEGDIDPANIISTTDTPELRILPSAGEHTYRLLIKVDVCQNDFAPSDPVTITVADRPEISVDVADIDICIGDTIRLAASSADTGYVIEWRGPNGYTSDQLVPAPIAGASSANSGIYTLYASRQGCIDSSSVMVNVESGLPKPEITVDTVYCQGENFSFQIANYELTDSFTYRWIKDGRFHAATLVDSLSVFESDSLDDGEWRVVVTDGECFSDTSDIVDVSILTRLNLTIDFPETVCDGDSIPFSIMDVPNATFSWTGPGRFASTEQNPKAPSRSGIYTLEITRARGCVETYTARVRVEQAPIILSIRDNADECTAGDQTLLLDASTFPDNDVTYRWTGPNGFESTDERMRLENYTQANNGIYELVVSRGECASAVSTFELNVNERPTVPQITGDSAACLGQSVRLDVANVDSATTEYLWVTPNGMVNTTTPYLEIDSVDQNVAGQYFVAAQSGSCQSAMSDTMILSVFSTPAAPTVTTNAPICLGEDLVLKVAPQNNTTYEWVGPNGFSSTLDEVVIQDISIEDQGEYRVRIFRNGCPSEYTSIAMIDFADSPAAPSIESGDIEICQSAIRDLELCIDRDSFDADVQYEWYNATTDQSIGMTNNLCLKPASMVNFAPGINTVVARTIVDGCRSLDSRPILVEVFGEPDLTARVPGDIRACDTENVSIAAIEPLRGTGRWSSIDPNVAFADDDNFRTEVFGLSPGENVLLWSLSNGPCQDYSSAQLIVTVVSDITAADDEYTIGYNEATPLDILENDVVSADYEVKIVTAPSRGSAIYDTTQNMLVYTADPRHSGEVTLEYEICDKLCNDICSMATVTLTVGNSARCFGSNIITPNGDGINDQVVFPCIEDGSYPDNELRVYNDRGDEIYMASPYANDWAGTYKGKTLPTGTYYYVFRPSADAELIKGYLIVQR